MRREKREKLEKDLKKIRRSFWLNVVLLVVNVGIYVMLHVAGTPNWFPLGVAGFMGVMAMVANKHEKTILIELGREKEI